MFEWGMGWALLFMLDLIIAYCVWWDANNRRDRNAAAWALGTLLIVIVVLPLYLYHRAYGPKPES